MKNGIKSCDRGCGFIFDKKQTNIAKGVALLILLWHHLFYYTPGKAVEFTSLFSVKGIPVECFAARSGKVCVAVFLFLSGYGLYKSFSREFQRPICKSSIKYDLSYVKKHLIKLMTDYWIAYIIFVPIGFFAGRNPIDIYESNIGYFILDLIGLSNIFNTPTMNPTWWFMSLIIVLYLIYPLLHRVAEYSAEVLLVISYSLCICFILPDISNIRLYLFPFVLGMYFSKYNLFYRLSRIINTWIKRITVSLLLLIITLWLKYLVFLNGTEVDGFLALAIIINCFLILSSIPLFRVILEHLGICSGLVFMFHTFIFSFYLHDFIYSFNYSLLIFAVLTVVCFIIAEMIVLVKSRINLHLKKRGKIYVHFN